MIDKDEELGFVGATLAAAGGIGKGVKKIGKIFKKKKKKKAAAKKGKVIQVPETSIVGEVKKAASESDDTAGAIRALASSIPSTVRDIVMEALKAQSLDKISKEKTMNQLAEQVDSSFEPKITAMLSSLKAQDLQKRATYEHNKLASQAKFRDQTTSMLKQAFDKLSSIEARLNVSAIVPPGKISLFGNRNILE